MYSIPDNEKQSCEASDALTGFDPGHDSRRPRPLVERCRCLFCPQPVEYKEFVDGPPTSCEMLGCILLTVVLAFLGLLSAMKWLLHSCRRCIDCLCRFAVQGAPQQVRTFDGAALMGISEKRWNRHTGDPKFPAASLCASCALPARFVGASRYPDNRVVARRRRGERWRKWRIHKLIEEFVANLDL